MEEDSSSAESGPDTLQLLGHTVLVHVHAHTHTHKHTLSYTYVFIVRRHIHVCKHKLQDVPICARSFRYALWILTHSRAHPHSSLVQLTWDWIDYLKHDPLPRPCRYALWEMLRESFFSLWTLERWTSIINIYSWQSIMDAWDWVWPTGGFHRVLVDSCQKHQRQRWSPTLMYVCLQGLVGSRRAKGGGSPHMGVFSSSWSVVEWSI